MHKMHTHLLKTLPSYRSWHHNKRHIFYHWVLFISIALLFTNIVLVSINEITYQTNTPKAYAAVSEPLLHKGDLTYVGSFRFPVGSGRGFDYSDAGVAYNPANNSLFKTGSTFEKKIAEISIPTPVNYNVSKNLPKASILQNLVDATEGNFDHIDAKGLPCCVNGDKFGGLLVYGSKLIGTVFAFYDGAHDAVLSHFKSGLNLSTSGDFGGMYQLSSPEAGFVAGYMASVPSEWQASLGGTALTGQCCLPIIGRTSSGPSAFVFNPDDLGVKNPVPSTSLIYYPLGHDNLGTYANSSVANPLFNKGTDIGGMVFPSGTQSVLYFGRTGLGIPCYGTGDSDISLHLQPVPGQPGNHYCYDQDDHNKGGHAYPYSAYVWAYDVQDLIAVKNGSKNPWDVRPYDSWTFNYPTSAGSNYNLGVAYDQSSQKIYVVQNHGDPTVYDPPIVHVYQLNVSGVPNPTPPSTPSPAPTPAPTVSFSASPTSINSGLQSILTWSTNNTSSVSINQNIGTVAVNGTTVVAPTATTTYTITATGTGGSTTSQTTITVTPSASSDTTAPTIPTNITASTISSSQINLSWTASTDAVGVAGYAILRNGAFIGNSKTNSYSDTGLTQNTSYSYTVVSYDAAQNNSAQSASINAKTNNVVASDTTPPIISSITSSSIKISSVHISWITDENSDSQVEYGLTTSYGASSSLDSTQTSSHSINLTNLTSGTVYHYRVKSKDASNNLATSADDIFTTAVASNSPQPTATISITPSTITKGGDATLTWSTTDATFASINKGVGKVSLSGSMTINPLTDSKYILTAKGPGGNISAVATIIVNSPVAITPSTPPVVVNPNTPKVTPPPVSNSVFGATTVKLGTRGSNCQAWQSYFNKKTNAGLKVDGVCGRFTIAAAKAWQRSVGLNPDGLLGPASRAKAK